MRQTPLKRGTSRLKRTRLRSVGKKKPTESPLSLEHEAILMRFWAIAGSGFRLLILGELQRIAALPGKKRCARNHFSRLKAAGHFGVKGRKCVCCGTAAQVPHHIIPLCNGGPNHKLNIAPVCNRHHELIHPHLKERRNAPRR